MEQLTGFQRFGKWLERSASAKALILGFLFLVLLIPMQMISGLVRERENRKLSVTEEVSSKWGGDQRVIGPLLVVPYLDRSISNTSRAKAVKRYFYVLPQSLDVQSDISTQTRRRSIYDVTLYENQLSVRGQFSLDVLRTGAIAQKDWLLKESRVILAISDLKGIQGQARIRWQDQDLEARIGMPPQGLVSSLIEANLPQVPPDQPCRFSMDLRIRGSRRFFIAPAGKQTNVSMQSNWPHPSFDGMFLPGTRTISPSGFSAQWDISYLNRQLPQGWTSEAGDAMYAQLQASSLGVVLTQPVNHYSKTERSTKYAGLFFVLTFAVFFLNEVLAGRLFHPVQYLMVGFALSLFYLLLLSLSEFLPFSISYAVAAGMITVLLTAYVYGVFPSRAFAAQLGLFFSGLYAFLYALLQLEDHALLVGSLALFVALSWIMLASRKIDWYRPASRPVPNRVH